jgi:hypothetical protein
MAQLAHRTTTPSDQTARNRIQAALRLTPSPSHDNRLARSQEGVSLEQSQN